jgi:hypothetical protein
MEKKRKRDTIRMRDDSVRDFVNALNQVISAVYSKDKRDDSIIAIRDKFNVIRKEAPDRVITMAGPYLWKYREQIGEGNVNFFLNCDFEEDIKEAQRDSELAEITEFSEIPKLLGKAKRIWHCFTKEEKNVVMNHIKTMLQKYACYVSAEKSLGDAIVA